MVNLRDFVLGVLWHDIGKFKQRTRFPEDQGKTHSHIGAAWLEEHYSQGLIPSLAACHHGQEADTWKSNLSLLAYEGDNCAASERKAYDPLEDRGQEWQARLPLVNIFGRVQDPRQGERGRLETRRQADFPAPSYLPLAALGEWQEPLDNEEAAENSPSRYQEAWQEFEHDFRLLADRQLHRQVNLVLHLLEKHLSTVPSLTLKVYGADPPETYRKHPDISLFDHLKAAAALAHCLYSFHQERHASRWDQQVLIEEITGPATWEADAEAPFLLVGGDLSGVQHFIYTIASTGALKGLKGRSFFLELFTEHVVDCLLKELELTRCNLIFSGGGHFYLLAPHTERARLTLERQRREANDYLFQTFNGQLRLCLEWEPLNKSQLSRAGEVWGRLSAGLEQAKRRPWEDRLEEVFTAAKPPHAHCFTDQCAVCGREDLELMEQKVGEAQLNLCPPCREQYRLGEELQKALREGIGHPVIAVWQKDPPDQGFALKIETGGHLRHYRPVKALDLGLQSDEVFHLNTWDLGQFTHPGSRPLLFSCYHEGTFKDLESLVETGFGMPQGAVLQMDVDNLGLIFSRSLAGEDDTLARKASLSRQLSLFFKFHLDGVLKACSSGYEQFRTNLSGKTAEDRKLAVIYAGGDDLFILGHWLDVLEAALDINRGFGRFTANPFLTLSGGLVTAPAHTPIYRWADWSGEAEVEAKGAKGEEKNCLGLGGGRVFTWKELEEDVLPVLEDVQGLLGRQKDRLAPLPEGVGSGFFYRLLQLCRDSRRQGALKLPVLAWVFGRHQPRRAEAAACWQRLKNYAFSTNLDWQSLETALLWTLMMMRRGGER
jgi:CRISPR-associated protein Csm1